MADTVQGLRLLEREQQVNGLESVLEAAQGGSGRTVVVKGGAGIGKTALLDAAADAARVRGFEVLTARADELESELSFGVCLQLFEPVAGEPRGGNGGGDPFAGAAGLARPILDATVTITPAVGEDRILSLIHGLYWLCANIADNDPLLLVVDDAHWGDVPSLRFLHFVSRRLDGLRAVVLVAARPDGARPPADRLLDAITGEAGGNAIEPGPLSAGAVATMIEEELEAAEPGFARACHRLTGGNPLYVLELLRSARENGLEPTDGDAEALAELRPEGVAESVLARLAGLGDDARRLAEVAAVGGGRLSLRDASNLAGIEVGRARRAADTLATAAILAPGEPLRFGHPLVQAAVYGSAPDAHRAGLHLRVAELHRDAGASSGAVAAHLLSAERKGGAWVVDALQGAAAEAMSHGSPVASARYLRRALEENPVGERRGQILVALGLAETEAGDPEAVERMSAAIELLSEPEGRAGALLGLGTTLTLQARVREATDAYERGIAELAGSEGAVARSLETMCVIGLAQDLERRRTAMPRVESLLRDQGLGGTAIGRLLLAHAAAERAYEGGSRAELVALADRAIAPGIDSADPATFWVYVLAAYAFNDCDQYDRSEAVVADALGLACERGSVVQAAAACHPRAFANLRRGQVAAALDDAQSSIDGAEQGWRAALPSSKAVLAEAHLERGEPELAAAAVELPGGDERWERLTSYTWLLASRAQVALERGEAETALATFRRCGELRDRAGLANPSVLSWRSGAALAAASIGDPEQAVELAEEDLRLAQAFGAPRAIGAALRSLALVVGEDEGTEHLREAIAVLEGSPARLEHMRALVDLGAALRRSGHRRDARAPLREGLDLAQRSGARAIAERAQTELAAAGARPRRHELSGVASLTPSERRIAAMAAEGSTNPQIAQALFLTRRTVEMHLTNTYRKLAIGGRGELAVALGGGGERAGTADRG